MGIRWSGYWVGLGVLASTCVGALAAALGSWYRRELLEQGIRLVTDTHYGSAVRVLRRAEALTPGDARTHYYLSLAYAGIGNFGTSLGNLEEAMRQAAGDPCFQEALAKSHCGVESSITSGWRGGRLAHRTLLTQAPGRAGDRQGMEHECCGGSRPDDGSR